MHQRRREFKKSWGERNGNFPTELLQISNSKISSATMYQGLSL